MKETKEIRNVKKYGEKVFTKERRNSRIKKNYNPLKVNYKIYKRGSGLLSMKSVVLKKAKTLSKKYNRKEELILKMIEKCNKMGYNIKSIEEFYNK